MQNLGCYQEMTSKRENISYTSSVLSAAKVVDKFKMVRRIGMHFDNPKTQK